MYVLFVGSTDVNIKLSHVSVYTINQHLEQLSTSYPTFSAILLTKLSNKSSTNMFIYGYFSEFKFMSEDIFAKKRCSDN